MLTGAIIWFRSVSTNCIGPAFTGLCCKPFFSRNYVYECNGYECNGKIFTAPCYLAMERWCHRLTSVCPSVCLWRWWIVITYVELGGILLHG